MYHIEFQKELKPLAIQIVRGEVYFITFVNGKPMKAILEGVKMTHENIIKAFPDLAGKPFLEIRNEAIRRQREKFRSFKTEGELKDYIIKELESDGYTWMRTMDGSQVMAMARKLGSSK